MRNILCAVTFAATTLVGGAAFAEGKPANAFQCSISCNQGYSQCMRTGVDWSLVKAPSEVGSRTSSNMSTAAGCRAEAAQCYKECRG